MACYRRFAHVYDFFMADTPYDQWAAYIDRQLHKYLPRKDNPSPPLVLDMACGTGSITVRLARMGYDMIGVDLSEDMLAEAHNKADKNKFRILFLKQDMRVLDLYGTVDAVVSTCDGLNYLLQESALTSVFERVSQFLNPGGIFIFDMNTKYKFKEVLRDKTYTEAGAGASYLWKNYYDTSTGINEYSVNFFLSGGKNKDEHFEEVHHQRAYPAETVVSLLHDAGLNVLHINEAYTDHLPAPDSERLSFIAVKNVMPGSVV